MPSDPKHPYGPPNILTAAQVFNLAAGAGFSTRPVTARGPSPTGGNYSDASIATAIASAESGLDARIVNPVSGATGLWQINPGNRALANPTANAAAARIKFMAQGWGAWDAYKSGAYRSYLGSVTSKPGAVKTQGVISNPIESIGSFLSLLTRGSTWLRVLFVLVALFLLGWGAFLLVEQTKVGKAAISAATKGAA